METFKINAVHNGTCYHHFGIHPSIASLYGDKPEDIEELTLVIADDQSIPDVQNIPEKYTDEDYWGWLDNDGKMSMVYPQRFLLNMCFPSGIVLTEKAGQGKAYRLNIVK